MYKNIWRRRLYFNLFLISHKDNSSFHNGFIHYLYISVFAHTAPPLFGNAAGSGFDSQKGEIKWSHLLGPPLR